MGVRAVLRAVGLVVVIAGLTGCQTTQPVIGSRLIAHAAMIDFSGLAPCTSVTELNVEASIPEGWAPLPSQRNALFVHYQWRSATHMTGIGIVNVHLPLPMSAKALLWLASAKYSSNKDNANSDGKLLSEWTDSIGREWFEAENSKYHVRGYAVTSGFDAWVVYTGYRLRGDPNPVEISLASRSMDSIIPLPLVKQGSDAKFAK